MMHALYMILLWHSDAELVVILQGPPGQPGFPGNPGLPVGSWFFQTMLFPLITLLRVPYITIEPCF